MGRSTRPRWWHSTATAPVPGARVCPSRQVCYYSHSLFILNSAFYNYGTTTARVGFHWLWPKSPTITGWFPKEYELLLSFQSTLLLFDHFPIVCHRQDLQHHQGLPKYIQVVLKSYNLISSVHAMPFKRGIPPLFKTLLKKPISMVNGEVHLDGVMKMCFTCMLMDFF